MQVLSVFYDKVYVHKAVLSKIEIYLFFFLFMSKTKPHRLWLYLTKSPKVCT